LGCVPVAHPIKIITMITKISAENANNCDYKVQRPFVYKGVQYFKGEWVEATDEDLKFLLRNILIQ